MATEAHCAYCFECLSANLEKRKPISLGEIEALWDHYENGEDDDAAAAEQLKRESADAAEQKGAQHKASQEHKPAAISRLLNPTTSSSSSSSTPSATSSTPSLNSPNSMASSRTSLFSLPRRLARSRRSGSVAETTSPEEYPLFVTWNTVNSRGHKLLRGCIGTFEAQELSDGLRSYALTSAFEDTRFSPISARELPSLDCGITLLTDFETIRDPMDWSVGQHGLRISFTHQGRRFGATYLPDVAREQGWTKEETIVSLMRKAGWNGRSSEWRSVRDLNCVRYQGYKASLGYREWKEWRDWVEETGRDELEA